MHLVQLHIVRNGYSAKKTSKNRPIGTMVTENRSIDAAYYRELMTGVGGVFAKVKEKMPWLKETGHIIQHDGAKPHIGKDNPEHFATEGLVDGWHIRVEKQPPQSPDLNLLDLCLFASLQTRSDELKVSLPSRNIDDLMARVTQAWSEYDANTIDNAWKHLYDVYECILVDKGGNMYPKPHKASTRVPEHNGSNVDLSINMDIYNAAQNVYIT